MLSSSETSVQITNALEKLIDSGISLGERVLGALIIFIVGKFLVNWLNRLFARILEKRKVDPSIQSFLKSMVNILLLIMLILAVIGKLGIELTGFAALLASAGVAIGMALSGNLQNFAGGLIILLFRPYKVGDYIDASTGASGTVKEIQIFHTILITPDNKMVYVPNGAMSSGVITNYSNLDTRRIEWNFGVDYGEDFEKVEKILRNIIKADQRILTAPALHRTGRTGCQQCKHQSPSMGKEFRLLGCILLYEPNGICYLQQRRNQFPLPATYRTPSIIINIERLSFLLVGASEPRPYTVYFAYYSQGRDRCKGR